MAGSVAEPAVIGATGKRYHACRTLRRWYAPGWRDRPESVRPRRKRACGHRRPSSSRP
jgi:hypothetical protein